MLLEVDHPRVREVVFGRAARHVAPRKRMTVSEWADAYRILSSKQTAFAGRWRTATNPLLREPMDSLSRGSSVRDVVLMFPVQLGKTEVALNAIGYTMDHDPGPTMVCLPGEISLQKWSAQKLQPMIDETPEVREALTTVASRDARNTVNVKDFRGGQLFLEHAGSPARLKSSTVRKLVVDELDEFSAAYKGGDDPVALLDGRTSAFPSTYQRLYISTPQVRASSRIFALWERSDQRRYYVACPHCGERQPLRWDGLKWSAIAHSWDRRKVWYVCRECATMIDERHKPEMFAGGVWTPERPGAPIRGYHANGLYYAIGLGPRWSDLVELWLAAQGDPARLKVFVNDRLAEPWADKSTEHVRPNIIEQRAEEYPLRVAPHGVVVVTAGVDTQDDRLEVHLVGWGRAMSFWVVDYVVLPGNPAQPDVWIALADLLSRPIQHASGATLYVEATSIDMLGHHTERVKEFVRGARIRRAMASFGASSNTAPILGRPKLVDVTGRGQLDKRGVRIWPLGTVSAKHVLYQGLAADHESYEAWLSTPDSDDKPAMAPRRYHFTREVGSSYFAGLISEVYNPSKARYEKVRGAVRNEPLDTWVHAYAAAHHPELRLHRLTRTDWDVLEDRLIGAAKAANKQEQPAEPENVVQQAMQQAQATQQRPRTGRTWRREW